MLFFHSKQNENTSGNQQGLSVSVTQLIEQQQYLPYLFVPNSNITSSQSGDVKSAFKGRGMELEEVRAYNFGDDIRDIDWRVTARKREPYTKIYNEEKDREVTVFLDLSASMVFGTKVELKSVTATKVAALLGWLSLHNKDRFGILIYDGTNISYFKPQNNKKNLMAIFNKISQISEQILQGNEIGNMSDALKTLEYNQKGQGIIFILSDFFNFNTDSFKKIATLSKRNKIYCINIFDVLEDVAPQSGEYEAEFNGQKINFNSSTEAFKVEYQQHFAQNRNNIKKNCQKFLCKYIEIRTDIPVFKQLHLL